MCVGGGMCIYIYISTLVYTYMYKSYLLLHLFSLPSHNPNPPLYLSNRKVSFMSFFEMYRMGVPIYAPSPALLAGWHIRYQV